MWACAIRTLNHLQMNEICVVVGIMSYKVAVAWTTSCTCLFALTRQEHGTEARCTAACVSTDAVQDIEEMKAMPWDIIVLDERHASKSFAQKMYPVLHELSPKQRIAMRESSGDTNSDQLLAWAAFLRPSQYKVCVLCYAMSLQALIVVSPAFKCHPCENQAKAAKHNRGAI